MTILCVRPWATSARTARYFSLSSSSRFPRVTPLNQLDGPDNVFAETKKTAKPFKPNRPTGFGILSDDIEFKPTLRPPPFQSQSTPTWSGTKSRSLSTGFGIKPAPRPPPFKSQSAITESGIKSRSSSPGFRKVVVLRDPTEAKVNQPFENEERQQRRPRERLSEPTRPSPEKPVKRYRTAKRGEDSFIMCGLRPVIASAVRQAFPKIRELTDFQQEFVSSILAGKDIMAKEATGQGKTFAILLALLSTPRANKSHPTSVFMVSSPALANQVYQWASMIIPPAYLSSSIGLLCSENPDDFQKSYADVALNRPHVLVCTPQTLNAKIQEGLSLTKIKTLAVDEADSILLIPPKNVGDRAFVDYAKTPPLGVRFLRNLIYPKTNEGPTSKPQVILCSASLNTWFKAFVVSQEKWILPPPHCRIIPRNIPTDSKTSTVQKKPSLVDHHVLMVSPSGSIRNALSPSPLSLDPEPALPTPQDLEGKPDHHAPHPHLLEAFAEIYALNGGMEPYKRSILVVPSREAMRSTAADLKDMGIRFSLVKRSVEMTREESIGMAPPSSTSKPEKESAVEEAKEEDTSHEDSEDSSLLYIIPVRYLRGIDIPSLSAVYVLSPAIGSPADYMHIAGRLDRLSSTRGLKKGQVITLLRGGEQESADDRAFRLQQKQDWFEGMKKKVAAGELENSVEDLEQEAEAKFPVKNKGLERLKKVFQAQAVEVSPLQGLD